MTRRRIWGLLFGLFAALVVGVVLLAIFAGMGAALLALLVVVALVATLPIWFAPVYLAHRRGVADIKPIAVFTLLAGWTAIGWVAALVWVAMSPRTS